nr:hypothetical protein [Mesorhizobium metallidurans]
MPEASCEQVSHIANDQLEAVERRIRRLLGLRTELARMIKECKVATIGLSKFSLTLLIIRTAHLRASGSGRHRQLPHRRN